MFDCLLVAINHAAISWIIKIIHLDPRFDGIERIAQYPEKRARNRPAYNWLYQSTFFALKNFSLGLLISCERAR